MIQKTVYALLIGIDKYQHVSNLGGCKADIEKVKAYLSSLNSDQFSFQPKTLFDEEATKDAVVEAFQNHLIAKAGQGDVALMYFSGHGAQEAAAEVFWEAEPDKKIEGIVCHDSGKGGNTLLSDKEQRYLIHQLAQKECEILIIADSCHSADNTRSTLPVRRIAAVMPQREWSDFIFADQISESDMKTKSLETLLPQGRHIQMAACSDFELAYENEEGGMFTNGLLKALKDSNGKISYMDLLSRVKFAIKGADDGVSQFPQSYTSFGHEEDVFREFLSGAVRDRPLSGNIVFNPQRKEWIMDKGAIHGLGRDIGGEQQVVMVPLEKRKSVFAQLKEVDGASSVLEFEQKVLEEVLDQSKGYRGICKGLLVEPLYLYPAGAERGLESLKAYAAQNAEKWQQLSLFLVENEEQANFQILAHEREEERGAHFAVTHVGSDIPLFEQSKGLDEKSIVDLEAKLQSLSRWYFAKELKNPEEHSLGETPIELIFERHGERVSDENGVIILNYDDPKAEKPGTKVKIGFANTLDQHLYVSAIYLDRDIGISNQLIQQKVIRLGPAETAWAYGGREIPMGWRDQTEMDLIDYGVEFDFFMIQLIVSTEDFSVDLFSQKGLKRALTKEELKGMRTLMTKSLFLDELEEPKSAEGWTTQLYTIKTPNPRI